MKALRVLAHQPLQQLLEFQFVLAVGLQRRQPAVLAVMLFQLVAQVQHQGGVAAVVDDQGGSPAAGEGQCLQCAPPVVGQGLPLPGIDTHPAAGDGRGGMVLGGEDVAGGPAHLGAQFPQGLYQHRRLDGHVQRTGHPLAAQRLVGTVLAARGHEAGHLLFRQLDFLAAPIGQGQILDPEGHVVFLPVTNTDSSHDVLPGARAVARNNCTRGVW